MRRTKVGGALITRRSFAGRIMGAGIASRSLATRGPAQASATINSGRDFFYRPAGAWAADFIPFYKDGQFHLFYLLDWRDKAGHGEGTPWYQITTTDFVNFSEPGEMLPRGGENAQDLYVFTGSVVEGEGKYHIFYTGHNPHLRQAGKPEQAIMHAVSSDLLHWEKLPEDTFFAPADRFEANDWRDPFVFRNEDAGEYWMLNAARLKTGAPPRRRGCTSLCTSRDLKSWTVRDPFYSPGLFYTHECPDLFRIGDWWYLVFSEFSERFVTRYRMSRSKTGPWITPGVDTFDGRAFYAAKTASDGHRRYAFGWNPTREGATDEGGWNWGGNLVVHELLQNRDGTLRVACPSTVRDAFRQPVEPKFANGLGNVHVGDRLELSGGFACISAGATPSRGKLQARIRFDRSTRGCGLMLHVSDDYDSAYYIRLDPTRNRLVFDRWPRPGDVPFMVELERHIELASENEVSLTVLVDGTVCVVYANDRVAMNSRMYNLKGGNWGAFVEEGKAAFTGLKAYV